MVECWLPYGTTEVCLRVDVENLQGEAIPKEEESEKTPREIIISALSRPVGSPNLEEMVGDASTVAIALYGNLHPKAAANSIRFLVDELLTIAVPRDRITLVIGNGARAKTSKFLLDAIRSSPVLDDIHVIEHTFDSTDITDVDETQRGTPIRINSKYREASLKIAVGETRVDNYTGFTGAHTAIMPGISALESVEANRALIFKGGVSLGVIESNPVKEDAMQAAEKAGVDLALNLVTNMMGDLIDAYAGGLEESWSRAVARLEGSYDINVEGGADIVAVSAGGEIYDFDLYHAAWALESGSKVAKRGGSIILLAECPEGLGVAGMSRLGHIDRLSELERRYELGGEVVHLIRRVTSQNRVILVSSLPEYMAQPMGLELARSTNEAYERSIRSRRGRNTVVMPYGCSIVPVIN